MVAAGKKRDKPAPFKPKWSRCLYVKSGLPDNYCHKSFLESKRTNVSAHFFEYWPSVLNSGVIIQQLSSVVVFASIYVYLKTNLISVYELMLYCVMPMAFFGYFVQFFFSPFHLAAFKRDLINFLKFTLFTYGLSPILSTLTETISSDTIYAMSTFMLFLNLVFHNYQENEVAIASRTFSFNAALFACVCLASRFNTSPFHSFSLVTLSFILFALWPGFRRDLQKRFPSSLLYITALSVLICLLVLVSLRLWLFAFFYSLAVLFIMFFCPFMLVKMQALKKTIHGPWDEALINLSELSE